MNEKKTKVLMRDLVGRKVRSLVSLGNSLGRLPAGTIFKVEGRWTDKLHLWSEPCPTCGLSVYIRKVPRRDVELVDD